MKNEIKVSSNTSNSNVSINHEASNYYAYLAKQWAVSDKLINAEGYSAKYYADNAKTLINASITDIKAQIEEELETVSEQVTFVTNKANAIQGANEVFQTDIDRIDSELLNKVNTESMNLSLTGKADTDLSNCTRPYITETYRNGNAWYRVWSDGWCEQGNMATVGSDTTGTLSLVREYSDTNYECLLTLVTATTGMNNVSVGPIWVVSKTNSTFRWANDTWGGTMQWLAFGYLEKEEELETEEV